MRDQFGREICYLRLALTDRCNFRCRYCIGSGEVRWMEEGLLLTDEELVRVVSAAARLGIDRVKLTGGEPLLRPGLPELAARLRAIPGIRELTLTTNGFFLAGQAEALREAGIEQVNVSLDTLDREGFAALTGVDGLERCLAGIQAAAQAGFRRVKVNCVTGRGLAPGDPADLALLAREAPVWVRYIESMPLGNGAACQPVTRRELMEGLEARFGPLTPTGERGNGPAEYFTLPGFAGRIGFISPRTVPFCAGCNRIRVTPDGWVKPCLQYGPVLDLKPLLRGGADEAALAGALAACLYEKPRAHRFDRPEGPGKLEERNMSAIGG